MIEMRTACLQPSFYDINVLAIYVRLRPLKGAVLAKKKSLSETIKRSIQGKQYILPNEGSLICLQSSTFKSHFRGNCFKEQNAFLSPKPRYVSVTLHLLEKVTRYVTVTAKLELVLERVTFRFVSSH